MAPGNRPPSASPALTAAGEGLPPWPAPTGRAGKPPAPRPANWFFGPRGVVLSPYQMLLFQSESCRSGVQPENFHSQLSLTGARGGLGFLGHVSAALPLSGGVGRAATGRLVAGVRLGTAPGSHRPTCFFPLCRVAASRPLRCLCAGPGYSRVWRPAGHNFGRYRGRGRRYSGPGKTHGIEYVFATGAGPPASTIRPWSGLRLWPATYCAA